MPSGLAAALLVVVTTAGPAVSTAPSGVHEQYSRQSLSAYFELIAAYRAGRAARATDALLAWSDAEVDQAVGGLVRLRGLVRRCPVTLDEIAAIDLDAAVMLHTDASAEAYKLDDWTRFFFHLDRARTLVELRHTIGQLWETHPDVPRDGCRPPPPLTRRDWYLAVAANLQGVWELPTADRLAGFGLEAAPLDSEMLLVAGSIKEAIAYGTAQDRGMPPRDQLSGSAFEREQTRRITVSRTVERGLRAAAALFERALATVAAPLEARLRLGRVWSQLDRRADARRALEGVLAAEPATAERYLARLFLGRLAELEDDVAGAAEEYRRAVAIRPRCQAGRVALALALERTGGAGARTVLAGALAEPWPRDGWDDPWWTYYFGQSRQGRQLLDLLRRRVMVE